MPVLKSFAFASNRGGIGKTTSVVQVAAAYAALHTEVNVLVVDFSIHGDSTSLLLGGTQAPSKHITGIHTLGQQRAAEVAANAPQRTAAGLIQAALSHAKTVPSLSESISRMTIRGFARGIFASLGSTPKLDFRNHCVNVSDTTNAAAPNNLFITPSNVSSEDTISALELALLDNAANCGCTSNSWKEAIRPMRQAMTDTTGDWVLFFDTDAELVERAPSRLALAVADKAVMMLSSDWRAYIRLLADARNGLFQFLNTMHKSGLPHSHICMTLMNNVDKNTTASIDYATVVPVPGKALSVTTVPLDFTPAKDVHLEMSFIVDHVFVNQMNLNEFHPLWSRDIVHRFRHFCDNYYAALPKFTGSVDMISTGTGIPVVSLDASCKYEIDSGIDGLGKRKLSHQFDNDVLNVHKGWLNRVAEKLHAAYDPPLLVE